MDKVSDSYGPEMRKIHHTLKKALDPNNILAPGKSGIDLHPDEPSVSGDRGTPHPYLDFPV